MEINKKDSTWAQEDYATRGRIFENYMNRFNDKMLEINSFDQAIGIIAKIEGLNHERFHDNLIKHPSTIFHKINNPSWKLIIAEKYALSRKASSIKENYNPTWKKEGQSRKKIRGAQNRGPILITKFEGIEPITSQTPLTKPNIWTPFTLPISQILMQIKNKIELKRPTLI